MSESIVDLPLPDGPVIAMNCPAGMNRSTLSTMVSRSAPLVTVLVTRSSRIMTAWAYEPSSGRRPGGGIRSSGSSRVSENTRAASRALNSDVHRLTS